MEDLAVEFGFVFFFNAVLLGVGLAMDAFSVSLANGLHEPCMRTKRLCFVAGVFAFFQFLMPMIGWVCVHTVAQYFSAFEKLIPYIALALLLFIGGKMLLEGIRGEEEADACGTGVGFGALMVQGVATSIDALSVGFTIAEQMLLDKLNPAVTVVAPVKGKGGNNKKMIVAVIIVLIAGLLVGGAWWCVSNYTVEPAPMPEPEPVIEQPVVEPVPEVVVDPDVERMVEGGNYAVWGVFAEKANALKYKSMIERRYPHVKGTIYHHREDTMYLLALAQKSSRMACQNYIWDLQELDGLFDDMWVFTNK